MTGILNILAGSIAAAIKDGYFNLVTLLLPGNGTNGAQNNTFLDSSSNNFTITRNGNTTQGTFSPFSQTGWSNYFDGGANYLSASSSASPSGTEDFCIEFWYCPGVKPSNYPAIFSENTTYSFTTSLQIFDRHDAFSTKFSVYGCGINGMASTTTVTQGTWYHIAVTRNLNGGVYTLRLFVNGALEASQTGASGSLSANACYIGRGDTASLSLTYINAYVSNFRIVRGSSVYTSAFTPSTSPLTAITNTSLLTCQSNRFVDNSTNAYALTLTGSPSVQAFSPFAPTAAYSAATNGGSGYFDGSGDYLTVADNDALDLTGDFTIECWVYPTNVSPGYNSNMISRWAASGGTIYNIQIQNGGTFRFVTSANAYTGGSITPNTWTHVAATRSGTSLRLFRNGVLESTNTDSTSFSGTQVTSIGAEGDGASAFPGYICGARIVKGTAVYTAAFTPPTAPPTNITNTSLLANFTNAGITDATAKNDLETVGGAQISTTQSKFGGSSMYFDGTGDWLFARYNQDLEFGSGDFTVEGWVYFSSLPSNASATIVSYGDTDTTPRWTLYYDSRTSQSAPGLRFTVINSSATAIVDVVGGGTSGWAANTWYHVAITRSGNSWRLFRDGTQTGSTVTDTDAIPAASNNGLVVGAEPAGATPMTGYIDDLRITKGYARYTANFTAPTAAFPVQ